MVSRHVDDAHLMPGGAAGCAGATFARLRSAPPRFQNVSQTSVFMCLGSGAAIHDPIGPCGGSTGVWRDNTPLYVGCVVYAGP